MQTPTLAILVEREEQIRAFRARGYWEVHGTFRAAGGEYDGRWFDEAFKKSDDDPDARSERLWDEAPAGVHDPVGSCRRDVGFDLGCPSQSDGPRRSQTANKGCGMVLRTPRGHDPLISTS